MKMEFPSYNMIWHPQPTLIHIESRPGDTHGAIWHLRRILAGAMLVGPTSMPTMASYSSRIFF
jgi:hypothetical protein